MELRDYTGDVCTSAVKLNPSWLKHYNYEQLMTKLGGRNILRMEGAQFIRAVRFARKMKKSALSMYIELEIENNCQLLLQILHDGSAYRRNISCQLLKLNVEVSDRRRNQRAQQLKRDERDIGETRIKQQQLP